jgi:addiction module HigA family antidote
MHNPPHPGEIIREDCLKPLGLSVTAAAEWLGVSRQSLSELLKGRNGASVEMVVRLERARRSDAETWLGAERLRCLTCVPVRRRGAQPRYAGSHPPPDYIRRMDTPRSRTPQALAACVTHASVAGRGGRRGRQDRAVAQRRSWRRCGSNASSPSSPRRWVRTEVPGSGGRRSAHRDLDIHGRAGGGRLVQSTDSSNSGMIPAASASAPDPGKHKQADAER